MNLGKIHTDCWPAWILLSILIFSGFALIYLNYKNTEGFLSFEDFTRQIRQKQLQNQATQHYTKFLAYVFQNPQKSGDALNDMKHRLFGPSCKFQYDWSKNRSGLGYGADTPDSAREAYMGWMRCLADGIPGCYQQVDDAQRRFMAPGCSPDIKSKAVLTDISNVSTLFM